MGRFEGVEFAPEAWRPRVPTAAFLHARDEDTFWAALRVTAFSEEQIRAAVHEGQFSDPAAERLLGDVLVQRRDQIGRTYLPKLTPLVRFALDEAGTLTFENAAERRAGLPPPDGGYRAEWLEFDNATGVVRSLGEPTTAGVPRLAAPGRLPSADQTIVEVRITAPDRRHPSWSRPVDVYFRRHQGAWQPVGVDRGL